MRTKYRLKFSNTTNKFIPQERFLYFFYINFRPNDDKRLPIIEFDTYQKALHYIENLIKLDKQRKFLYHYIGKDH